MTTDPPPAPPAMARPDIRLEPFAEADLSFFASLARDPRVVRFVGDGRPWADDLIEDRTRAALVHDPIDEPGSVRWSIAREGDVPVGLFVTTRRESAVELGYWVHPHQWGRGVAGAMLDAGMEALPHLHGRVRLQARVARGNSASMRALARRSFEHREDLDGLELWERDQLAPSHPGSDSLPDGRGLLSSGA